MISKIKKRIKHLKSILNKQHSTYWRRCVELIIEELENLLKEEKWMTEKK